jgi:sarcosine oxidase
MYTNTPDRHFLIGPLAGEPRLVVVSACSGHGFKFAPAIGAVAADMAAGVEPKHDLTLFSPARYDI